MLVRRTGGREFGNVEQTTSDRVLGEADVDDSLDGERITQESTGYRDNGSLDEFRPTRFAQFEVLLSFRG
jgi:hypothetical protein